MENLLCVDGDATMLEEIGWVPWKPIAGGTEERGKEDAIDYRKICEIPEDQKAFRTRWVKEMFTQDRWIPLWMKKTVWGLASEFFSFLNSTWPRTGPVPSILWEASTSSPSHSVLVLKGSNARSTWLCRAARIPIFLLWIPGANRLKQRKLSLYSVLSQWG